MEEEMKNINESLEEEKKGFVEWLKSHKKQLLLAGISFATILGIILGLKNKEALLELKVLLEKVIQKSKSSLMNGCISEKSVSVIENLEEHQDLLRLCDVSSHVRTMAKGKHHSQKKADEAELLGIILLPNQTIVDSYTKYITA